ncbi:MAG: MFS transporter [Chloroflexota bacterium]
MAHRTAPTKAQSDKAKSRFGEGIGHTFASLSNPSYQAFWISLLASYSAMQMNIVARGYLAFVLTDSATALGVVSLARGLPMLVLSPFAGVVADRVDKQRLIVATQTGLMVVSVVTSALVHFHVIQFWHLVVLSIVSGVIFTFNPPARQALLPQLVDDDNLGNAIALNGSGRNLTRIVAPSVAGVMMGMPIFGISGAFDAISIAYLLAAVLLLRLQLKPVDSSTAAAVAHARKKPISLSDMGSGFRYILSDQRLWLLIVLGFVPVLLGNPYQTLLPVFQARVLDVGPAGLGMLYGAAGVGGLIGTLVVAALADDPRKAGLQLGFGILFGVALCFFALVHVFSLDLFFLIFVGIAGDGYSTLNSTMVMLNTDRAWYGRVMSIYMMNWSLMPLATLPLGAMSDSIGAPITEAIAGALIVALVIGVVIFYPSWRKLGDAAPTPVPRQA